MTRRVRQLLWVLDHTADLNADFRAFYRMSWAEAVRTLSGPELFQLAHRCAAYPGVMKARVEALAERQAAAERRATGGREVASRIDSDQNAIRASRIGDLFD